MNGEVKIKEEESLLSFTELCRSMAAEPQVEYNKK
jgi:hypothetical protein